MGFLMGIFVICILALDISILSKRKLEIIIPFTFSVIGMLVYIIFCLKIGQYSVGIIIFITLLLTGILVNKGNLQIKQIKQLITPGVVIWLGGCIIMSLLYNNRYTLGGDEHSVWAMAVKHMYYNGTFPCAENSNVSFKYYIPGKACLEYFFMKLNGIYSDEIIYKTLSMWMISLGLPIMCNASWKNRITLVFNTVLCIFFPFFFFNNAYSMVDSDAILVMLVSYILTIGFIEDRKDKFFIVWFSIMLASLTSIKSAGCSFACFILLIVIVDEYFVVKDTKVCFKKIAYPILSIVIISVTWRLMLYLYNYINVTPYASRFSIQAVLNIVTGHGTELEYTIWEKFARAFFDSHITQGDGKPFVSNIIILLIISILCYLCSIWIGKRRSIFLVLNIWICTLIYMIGLLSVYLFSFKEIEGLPLASYKRYSSIWFGGIIIFLIISILYNRKRIMGLNSKKRYIYNFFPLLLCIYIICNLYIVFNVYNGYFVFTTERANKAYSDMSQIETYKKNLDMNDRVYIVSQEQGYYFLYAKYLFTPIKCADEYLESGSEFRTWRMGTVEAKESTIQEKYYSVREWSEILQDYTYVYIDDFNDNFINNYGNIFENTVEENKLYKIVKDKDSVRLIILED